MRHVLQVTRWHRASRLAAIAAVIAVSLVVRADPGSAHSGWTHYQQFNMWGNAGHEGGLPPSIHLIGMVNERSEQGHTPFAISAQELCSGPGTIDQHRFLVAGLPSYTLVQVISERFPPETHPDCTIYGNGLFMLGPRTGTNGPVWDSISLPFRDNENRTIVCGHAWFISRHNACSTHLTNTASGAQDQIPDALIFRFNFNSGHLGGGQYFGGDLNLEPNQFPSDGNPYASMLEVDHCCNRPTFDTTDVLDAKIDYGFVPLSLFSDSTAVRWISPSISDHALLESHFDP
jgi:hypothetical protein